MPNNIGQGIATGLTNAISLALSDKSFDIRQARNKALQDVLERKADIAQGKLDLSRQIEFRQQQQFEALQNANKEKQKLEKIQIEKALEAEAKKSDWDTPENQAIKQWGDEHTPGMGKELGAFVKSMLPGESQNGLITTDMRERAFAKATDVKNPAPGGSDGIKRIFEVGIEDTKNQIEVNNAKLEKLFKKDPLLASNPIAMQENEEASQLTNDIKDLTGAQQQFRGATVETDQFFKQQEEAIRQARNEEIQELQTLFEDRIRRENIAHQAGAEEKKREVKIIADSLGNIQRFDKQTGEKLPLESEASITFGKSGEDLIDEVSRDRERLLITPGQILTGTGLGSNIRSAASALIGTFGIPGELAPSTTEAKNAIRSFNQSIKADLTINARNPVAELKTIEDFLIDEKSNIQDPDTNITKTINLVKRLEGDIIKFQDILNRGNVSKKQKIDLTNKINSRLGIISQMPTIASLKFRGGRIGQMTIEELESIPEEDITKGQAGAMIRRFNELGIE